MRIGFVLYWCVLAFHLCKADDVERTESKEGGRRQWGPLMRSGSMSDSPSTVSNDHSKLICH